MAFRTRACYYAAFLALFLWSDPAALRATAQTPPSRRVGAVAAPSSTITTLSDALAQTRPGEAGIVALAVGAQKTRLPAGTRLSPADVRRFSPAQTGLAFGRAVRRFDGVDAIAPPTMVVFGVPPAHPNPWDGMPPGDLVKLLAGTFTSDQWAALLSKRGLGLGDLTDDKQRGFFRALFPDNQLRVQFDVPGGANRKEDIQDVSSLLPQARLRLGERVNIGLPARGKPDEHIFGMTLRADDAPHRYVQVTTDGGRMDRVVGGRVRTETPNRPKPGQLDTEADVLRKTIPLEGLHTVGEVMARIARTTRVEIYADHRYEEKTVTFAGAADSAPAGGLLRALAFCVTGTYRKVGSGTWVLADDLVGVGTRRQLWADFEKEAEVARKTALDKAGDVISEAQPNPEIIPLAQPLALSPAQRKAAREKQAENLKHGEIDSPGFLRVEMPLNELTPAQQASARRINTAYEKQNDMTLEGTIIVQSSVTAELILPGFDGPIVLNFSASDVFMPSMRVITQKQRAQAAAANAAPRRPTPAIPTTFPDLIPVLGGIKRRAVYAHANNAADVDALLGSMKTLKLNELWLDVFSARTEGTGTNQDLLAHAIESAANTDIRVFAVLDLFKWKEAASPETIADLNLRGETSAQTRARLAAAQGKEPGGYARPAAVPPISTVAVSPFAPQTFDTLLGVMQTVAKQPGLAGVVWRETVTPGYGTPAPLYFRDDDALPPLGYTEPARVAFLRQAHTDPVDIYPSEYAEGHANTTLPNLDDFELDRALNKTWAQFRNNANIALLRRVARAVPETTEILVEARSTELETQWYGAWTDRSHRLPPQAQPVFTLGEEILDDAGQARKESSSALSVFPVWPGMPGPYLAVNIRDKLANQRWDGILLDTVNIPYYVAQKKPDTNPLHVLTLPWHPPTPEEMAAGEAKARREP